MGDVEGGERAGAQSRQARQRPTEISMQSRAARPLIPIDPSGVADARISGGDLDPRCHFAS